MSNAPSNAAIRRDPPSGTSTTSVTRSELVAASDDSGNEGDTRSGDATVGSVVSARGDRARGDGVLGDGILGDEVLGDASNSERWVSSASVSIDARLDGVSTWAGVPIIGSVGRIGDGSTNWASTEETGTEGPPVDADMASAGAGLAAGLRVFAVHSVPFQ